MITVLGKQILVKHKDALQSSLIEIPDIAKTNVTTKVVEAEVVNVGSRSAYKDTLLPTDIVLVHQHLGNRHEIDGVRYVMYDDEDVLAVLE